MAVSSGRRGAAIRLGVDTSQVSPALRSVANKLRNFSTTSRGDLSKITSGFTGVQAAAIVAGTAITGAAIAVNTLRQAWDAADQAYKRYAATATATRRVVALTGPMTETAVAQQSRREVEMSLASGLSRNEVSTAYYQAISAGARGQQADRLIDTAIKMNIASGVPLDTASQYLQVQENIFGTPASRVGDITRATEEAAITTVPELVRQQGYFLPQAKALGLGLEGGLAGYGAATLGGLGQQSGTSTGALYRDLLNPTTKLAVAIEKELGGGVKELIAQGETVADILTDLKSTMGESGFEALLTGETAKLGLFLATPEGVSAWNTVARNILDSDNKLQESADFIEESPEFILRKFRASWDNFIVEAGAIFAPAFNDLYTDLTATITGWTEDPQWKNSLKTLSEGLRDFGSVVVEVAELMLPLLIGGLDTFIDAMYEFQNDVAHTLNVIPGVNIPIAQRPSEYTRQALDTLRETGDTPTSIRQQRRLVAMEQGMGMGDTPYSIRTPLKGDYGEQYGNYLDFGEFSHILRDIPKIISEKGVAGFADELNAGGEADLTKLFQQVPIEWIIEAMVKGKNLSVEDIQNLFGGLVSTSEVSQISRFAGTNTQEEITAEQLTELRKQTALLGGVEQHTDPDNPANCLPSGAAPGSSYGTIDVLKVR